jgi:hypothetical protein
LTNGHFVAQSLNWDNPSGPVSNAGAVTRGFATGGPVGMISSANSVLGTAPGGISIFPGTSVGFVHDAPRHRLFVGRGSSNIVSIWAYTPVATPTPTASATPPPTATSTAATVTPTPTRTATPTTALTPTGTVTPSAAATPSITATSTPAPEVCDDCIDNDLDLAVDRADADCPPPADGGATGLGDPDERGKAAAACGKGAAKAGAKYVDAALKHLQKCLNAVFTCVQTKPGDDACLQKASATCTKEMDTLDDKDGPKLADGLRKVCGADALAAADLLAAAGVGYDAEDEACAAFGAASIADVDDVVTCVRQHHLCRASQMLGLHVPRAFEFLMLAGLNPASELPCLPAGADGGGDDLGEPGRGKAAAKCEKSAKKAAAKFV